MWGALTHSDGHLYSYCFPPHEAVGGMLLLLLLLKMNMNSTNMLCKVLPDHIALLHLFFQLLAKFLFNGTFPTFQHSKPRYVDTFDYQTKRSSKSKSMAAGADVIHKEERFPKVFSPTCEARSHLTFPKWRGDGMGQHLFIWYACDWWNAVRAHFCKHIENDALGCQTLRQVAFPKTLQELASLFATDEDTAATFGSIRQWWEQRSVNLIYVQYTAV